MNTLSNRLMSRLAPALLILVSGCSNEILDSETGEHQVATTESAVTASSFADGTLLRDPNDGTIVVVAGGARIAFATWEEYVAAGYENSTFVNVPRRVIDALPTTPSDGTLLRDKNDGTIVVVAGGAKIVFASWEEYVAAGYEYSSFVHVPRRVIDALPTA